MQLGYFTEEAYDRLLSEVKENSANYASDDEWLDSYFGRGVVYYGFSSVEVNKFTPYCMGEQKDDVIKEDLINARNLHDAFINLTPLQASNKYMWAYLCHKDPDCRKYIQHRWRDGNIEQRYFVAGEGDGLYFFNALSRLWWWAHITYDPENRKNPYELTEILFSNQMVGKDFLGTLNKANFTRTKGTLLALKEFRETLNPREGINQYYRECNKILNHYAAVNMLDYLNYTEIQDLVYKTLVQVRENNMRKNNN